MRAWLPAPLWCLLKPHILAYTFLIFSNHYTAQGSSPITEDHFKDIKLQCHVHQPVTPFLYGEHTKQNSNRLNLREA